MTRYERGFLTKCAERGLSVDETVSLCKRAGVLTAGKKVVGRGLLGLEDLMLAMRSRRKSFLKDVPALYDRLQARIGRAGYRLDPEYAFNQVFKRRGQPLPFPDSSIWHYLK